MCIVLASEVDCAVHVEKKVWQFGQLGFWFKSASDEFNLGAKI